MVVDDVPKCTKSLTERHSAGDLVFRDAVYVLCAMCVLSRTFRLNNGVERLQNVSFEVDDNCCHLHYAVDLGVKASGLKVDNSKRCVGLSERLCRCGVSRHCFSEYVMGGSTCRVGLGYEEAAGGDMASISVARSK